jgi:hypothetical protein
VLSALALIVASQVVLAGLLFGTSAIERPRRLPLTGRRRAGRRPATRDMAAIREHRRRTVGLQAAATRTAAIPEAVEP